MMRNLQKILQPYSLDRFLSENWTKQGILIPSEHPDKFQDLFSWQHLNDLLNYHKPELRFVKNGQVLPPCKPKEWAKLCREGASLAINHVNEHLPVLSELTWGMQEELGHSAIHANIYCSWPSHQGFKIHYDAHEVLVMQIHGQKEWFVFEDTFKYPYRDEKSEYHKPPEGKPYINCILKPGDLLYIPRGHWHYAIAREEPSLHLTLGIRCFTGRDVLKWLFEIVQKNLQEEETWRQNLPLMPNGNIDDLESYTGDLFDSLRTMLDREKKSLVHRFAVSQAMTVFRAPEISLPNQAGFGFFEQGLDTRLRQNKFQKLTIERVGETGYLLQTPKGKLQFKDLSPAVVDILVKKLFSQEAFTIRDVTHWLSECDLDNHILPLLAGLVKEGILVEDVFPHKAREEKTDLSHGIPKLQQTTDSNYAVSNASK